MSSSMQLLYDLAIKFVGTPYLWGGKGPLAGGLDCSGLCVILLRAFGLDAEIPVKDAKGLFDYFSQPSHHVSAEPQLGALVFYGNPVDHVMMCLSPLQAIGAEGGGSEVTNLLVARHMDAYVRVTPLFEKGRAGIFMPKYPEP